MYDGQSDLSRLLLKCDRGLQVWDRSTEHVREVLNLFSPAIGSAMGAVVIPTTAPVVDISLSNQRPVLVILTTRLNKFVMCSPQTHTIINQILFGSDKAI
ncbi:hypothetical protein FRC06_008509 [Ceratobasidium sp. 370]|nr:hypothetical protein FRC06_008509 [Ceratobasidium sp. 370]